MILTLWCIQQILYCILWRLYTGAAETCRRKLCYWTVKFFHPLSGGKTARHPSCALLKLFSSHFTFFPLISYFYPIRSLLHHLPASQRNISLDLNCTIPAGASKPCASTHSFLLPSCLSLLWKASPTSPTGGPVSSHPTRSWTSLLSFCFFESSSLPSPGYFYSAFRSYSEHLSFFFFHSNLHPSLQSTLMVTLHAAI